MWTSGRPSHSPLPAGISIPEGGARASAEAQPLCERGLGYASRSQRWAGGAEGSIFPASPQESVQFRGDSDVRSQSSMISHPGSVALACRLFP